MKHWVVPAIVLMASGAAQAALDSATAASGLREALQVGTGKAVDLLGRTDGYLENPEVFIPVPDKLRLVQKTLRRIGREDLVREFETGMNRAAEAAAPLAREVFVEAIREMTIEDALDIVRGKGHEATDYLREHAGPALALRFRPIVDEQMETVGATQRFDAMMQTTAELPFVQRPAFDLGEYVTQRALDGLFLMIAREEERIREDPLARTSDLLQQVFGPAKKKSRWKRLFGRD